MPRMFFIILANVFLGCSALAASSTETLGGVRPAGIHFPSKYSETGSWPLLVFLHGFTSSAVQMDFVLGLSREREKLGYVLILPEGTKDGLGRRFWNATPYCCGDSEARAKADDAAYLRGLVEEALAKHPGIDARRVYFVGHSNGGFMAYRMACEFPNLVSKVVSIAGSTFVEAEQCGLDEAKISVLQIHGTKDDVIRIEGEAGKYPSALETASRWANLNGCSAPVAAPRVKDLSLSKFGKDTDVLSWNSCASGGRVELWTIQGGNHTPFFTGNLLSEIWSFLRE